jgi:hypothetical protein
MRHVFFIPFALAIFLSGACAAFELAREDTSAFQVIGNILGGLTFTLLAYCAATAKWQK